MNIVKSDYIIRVINYLAAFHIGFLMSGKCKVGSMFAGIGGICLGFKQAGAEIVWANEIDRNACVTYRENMGSDYLVERDIYKVTDEELDDVHIDILTAGFPCQAFSIAGYRLGFEDERGVLFNQVIRVIKHTHPKVVFCENVKNLQTHDSGNTYRTIKKLLIEEGYDVVEKVMNTMEYGNIPQNRERIYIVAFKKDLGIIDKFRFPQPIPLTRGIHDIINIHDKKPLNFYYSPDHKYYSQLDEAMTNPDTVYQWRRVYVRENKSNVCPTLTANMGTGGHNVPIIRDDFGIRKMTPGECFAFQGFEDFKMPKMALSHLYKQAGNSVSVPVIRRIAENILELL